MSKPEETREPTQANQEVAVATNLTREAEELVELTLEVKTKADLCKHSRQKAADLRRRAESLKDQMQAAKDRAQRLQETAQEIIRKNSSRLQRPGGD